GPLALRLEIWEKQKAIPAELKDVILPSDLEHQKTLAAFLREDQVKKRGLDIVFSLIKVPASRDSFGYWWGCVQSILEKRPLPLPIQVAAGSLKNEDTLLNSENIVEQCDIYLWISNRMELARFALEKEKVLNYK